MKTEPTINSTPIGSKMSAPEFKIAQAKLGGDAIAFIALPKQHAQYAGKVLQCSDTHLVQRVSKNIGVAHDLSKLENGDKLRALAEKGELRNVDINISYNDKTAQANQIVFDKVAASAAIEKAKAVAITICKNPIAQDAFIKHVTAAAQKHLVEPNFKQVLAPILKTEQQKTQQQSPKR
jgi:hypothetical protein